MWQRWLHDTDLTICLVRALHSPQQPLDIRTITVSTLQMSKLRFRGKAQAFATNLMTGKNQSPIWVLLTLLDATTCCCLPWLLKDPGGEPSPRTQTWG